ncbi:CACTA en-spm transposon protein [Cucumis melo var. makuwa]|uniref:CACTA en-spm transposon protein n=1 Tax=Cucumis melo var. makuwa TaxID=1194695 RepID=A0A5D3BHB6_CUCMM|nr:CACTA en-spm transposon protein [Cucumis melo var. makuwa]TYJ98653.1 CACTA en-spm transposon protein [Cucumis melo var. makuwa]
MNSNWNLLEGVEGHLLLLEYPPTTQNECIMESQLALEDELAEQRGESVDRVELFLQTHIRDGIFVPQVVEDAHSPPTLEGTQPLSGDEICKMVLDRRSNYSKDLGWGPKTKARRTANVSVPRPHVCNPR